MALVVLIHFCGDRVKAFSPAPSKPLEFEGFEIRIIQAFPNSEIFDRIPIAQLIADHRIRVVALVSRDVRQTDIVVLIEQYNCNICVPYRNLCHICIVFFTANIL